MASLTRTLGLVTALLSTFVFASTSARADEGPTGAPSRAQVSDAPAGARRVLGQDALVSLALAQNPELRAARHERQVAEAGVVRASALENPTLRVEWLHAITPDRMGFGLGLGWNPPQPTVYAATRAAAKAHTREVEEELVEQAWDLEASVRAGYVAVEAQSELLFVAKRTVETRRALLEVLRERVAHGASTKLEASLAAISVARAEQERDALALQRETTLAKLAGLAGLPAGASLELPAPSASDDAQPVPDLALLERRALAERASLKADAARAEQREQVVTAEKAKRYPWISLASAPRYRYSDMSNITHDLAFAVDVSLPIFDTNAGRIQAAEAERAKVADVRSGHVAGILREVAVARNEAVKQRELFDRYRAMVAPLLTEHASLVQEALKGHQVDYTAVLQAEDVVLRTERELCEAKLGYKRARIALARASGGFPRGESPR